MSAQIQNSFSPVSPQKEFPTLPPPTIHGLSLTPLTQCAHWHSPLDIIAIKHACCRKFYACVSCHNVLEEHHQPQVWKKEDWDEKAVICGQCKTVWSVQEYLEAKIGTDGKPQCGSCGAKWNPGCKKHWGLYFDVNGEIEQ